MRTLKLLATSLLILPLLASCNVGPTVRKSPTGAVTMTTGLALLSKSDHETASVTSPDGWTLTHDVTKQDSAGVALSAIRTAGTISATKSVVGEGLTTLMK